MNADFWHSRWAQQQIGFHEGRPNEHLERLWGDVAPDPRVAVFVPLCGKAEDLAWLNRRGHRVVGVELVESAVRAFFDEHALTPTCRSLGPLTAFEANGLTLFAGDFFSLTAEHLGGASLLYDRAALIALPAPMRVRYVEHLRSLMPRGARGLLVTVTYDQAAMEGPPFSVPEDEVRRHFVGLDVAAMGQTPATGPRLEKVGALEAAFRVVFESA